jgi:mono/diheme cytochrome c family protein
VAALKGWRCALALSMLLPATAVLAQGGSNSDLVDRGHYLALAGNCASCHTRAGGAPFAGGVEFQTPYGVIYSTNVTQDPEDGIGKWTLAQFARALRQGIRADGANLYPAFPYTEFTRVSDDDVAALYAYFKTIAPVHAVPPADQLHFPYNQRWALGIWNRLYLKPGPFKPDPKQSQQWNRGAYLVQGLGHCGECHTPRGFLSSQNSAEALSGAVYRDNVNGRWLNWSSVNLTSAADGLGSWSAQDIADYLKYGYALKAGVFGAMNEVIGGSTRFLTDADAQAIAVYLKSLPPIQRPSGAPLSADQMDNGQILYSVNCATCHLPTGLGSADTGPPMAGSPIVQAANPQSLINITLYGGMVPQIAPSTRWAARTWQTMNPSGDKLSDADVATLLSYIRASFGNHSGAVTAAQVAAQR